MAAVKSPVVAVRTSPATKFALALSLLLAAACSSKKPTPVDGAAPSDAHTDTGTDVAGTKDAATTKNDAATKTDAAKDAGPSCAFGQASSQATATDLDLFGTPAYFNDDQPIPAGTYRLTYLDGCMKYGSGQGWTVNAYADGRDGWWLVGATTSDKILVLPGTIGYAPDAGAFSDFASCVAASLLSPPVTFTHTGGVLGIWLQDSPYSDNTAGENDRNPSWRLDGIACTDAGTTQADATAGQ
jgi:hypothetical protein